MERQTAERQAKALVAQMTLEEQAAQLKYNAPAIERLGVPAYNWWNEALHGVARAGTATVFPQAISLAAMFDEAGLKDIAGIIATEGRAKYHAASAQGDRDIYKGLTFWSPNINLFRDPRWGRGQETYGEDPFLTARLGVAFIKGLQGEDGYLKAAACAKHFAVHSGPEKDRHAFNACVSPKDLWESYLPAFEAAVCEAGVEAVMGAYNRVNDEPCCGSQTLLVEILRKRWGFKGHVVSDCWAISDFHQFHHVTDTAPESAALAIRAGCDLNCGVTYLHLLTALAEGRFEAELITRSCERLFTTRFMLGLFDENCAYNAIGIEDNDTQEHAEAALKAAEKSMVLLKNDGLLPLKAEQLTTVAVIGPNADQLSVLNGNYHGTSSRYVTFLEGARAALEGKARVMYAKGAHLDRDKDTDLSACANDRLAEAIAMAQKADVTLLFVGLDPSIEGEQGDAGNRDWAGDKPNLRLPPSQQVLIEAMAVHAKKLVTVLVAGSALAVDTGNAVIWAGYPGQAGGTALMRLVLGEVSPSGRLPVTFYQSEEDLPDFSDYSMKGRTYRYIEKRPLYPFGYGLGYTEFAYSDASSDGKTLKVSVQNIGKMPADEVVQIYIKDDCPDSPPNARLCGFKRIHLAAGEKRTLTLPIPSLALTAVNEKGERIFAGPNFTLFVGGHAPDAYSEELCKTTCLRIGLRLEDI